MSFQEIILLLTFIGSCIYAKHTANASAKPFTKTNDNSLNIAPRMYHKQQWQDSGQSQRDAKKSSVCLGTSFSSVGLVGSWITTPRASSSRITSLRICLNASRCSSARIALTRKSLRWFAGICCRQVQARRWSGILSCGRKTYCGRFTPRSPRPERGPKCAQNRWRSPGRPAAE